MYSEFLLQDKKKEFEKELNMTEYLASFWNAKAVEDIRNRRENQKKHSFQSEQEFEQNILSETYKNMPLVKAIQEIKKRAESNNVYDKEKQPTDLSLLAKLAKKF